VYYLGSVYLSLYVHFPLWTRIAFITVSIVGFTAYAPAQTRKRPIPEAQYRTLKKKSLAVLAVVSLIAFALHQPFPIFSNLIVMAMTCQTINLLPSTYRIFNEQ